MHVIFCSGGNDSVALLQFAKERGLTDVHVCYSDTGWAADFWPERIARVRAYAETCGFTWHDIKSEGMVHLVRRKRGWPANKPRFCTAELKILPALAWLEQHDPEEDAICMVGVRREESAERAQWPELVDESENHGFRTLWSPLVRHREADRNELIARAGFEVLPYRSKECFPCVNANREDLRMLGNDEARVTLIAEVEGEMGPRKTMFRPKRFLGAHGIREVIRWANSSPGQYAPGQFDLAFGPGGCDSGMCGD